MRRIWTSGEPTALAIAEGRQLERGVADFVESPKSVNTKSGDEALTAVEADQLSTPRSALRHLLPQLVESRY